MSESASIYVVRPGDTVRSVATALGIPAMELCKINGLRPGDQLKPGQKLRLPSAAKSTPAPTQEKTQVFDTLRQLQTQMLQAQKAAPSKRTEQDASTDSFDNSFIRAKLKAKLPEKDSSEIRSSTAIALQAKRLSDQLLESSEMKLLNPFGSETDPPTATAEKPKSVTPPSNPPPADSEAKSAASKLFARRRQKAAIVSAAASASSGSGTDAFRKTAMFEASQSREATKILSLTDLKAPPGTSESKNDSFRHLDENASGKKGSDQFKSLTGPGANKSKGDSDSFKMAGNSLPAPVAGGDRFSTNKKVALADADSDIYRRYRSSEEAGEPNATDAPVVEEASESTPLRKEQLRIGSKRIALPNSMLTQGIGEPERMDPLLAKALETAIEPSKQVKVELGPGLSGPETSLKLFEALNVKLHALEILRSKDSRYLLQISFRGNCPPWAESSLSETYQFNPDQTGELSKMFMLLSRPQPPEFMEKLRAVKRESELGPFPSKMESCLSLGFQASRAGNGPKTLQSWVHELLPQGGGFKTWEEARADQVGAVHLVPSNAALASKLAQTSLTMRGPSPLQGVWHSLLARAWKAGQSRFLDELAGPFQPEERMLSIGWIHQSSGPPRIEFRLLLSESWAKKVKLAPPFQASAESRIEICWSASSPKWTQRPKAVEALWKSVEGTASASELPMADTFATSFFRQATLSVLQHPLTRKPFADFGRVVLSENRVRGENAGQGPGRSPAQLWTPL